ncbi:actin-binding lim protein 2-like [Lynx pardinus]|uniref:Actin-binding lim protein 2-like n=1 Tax=Lynx pardinus TaxID=191816 RepID=A0A485ML37_LYNPA|nr:actin-binding lim protein 2-like [Lynx pardinus]
MGMPGGDTVSEPQAAHSPLEKSPSTAILCNTCGNVCKGEVLRVQNKYFHIKCFVCKACGCDLAEGGFFVRQGEYICTRDYQRLYGTRCFSCDRFIEGEVVSALGKTYHPDCFVCAVCRLPFPPGDRVTFNGKECVCQKCSLPKTAGGSVHLSQGLWSSGTRRTSWVPASQLLSSKRGRPWGPCRDGRGGRGTRMAPGCLLRALKESLPEGAGPDRPSPARPWSLGHSTHSRPVSARRLGGGTQTRRRLAASLPWRHVWDEGAPAGCPPGDGEGRPPLDGPRRQVSSCRLPFQETRSSSESIISVPASSTSGSPSRVIYAKLGDEILDYRDLAALPKSKAIYNIDRPDMISYSPYISHAVADRQSCSEGDQDDRSYKQCRTSSPSSTGSVSLGRYTPTSRSPQHYSRPGSESGRSTPSLSVLSDSKPPPCTYQQAPRHFHVPDTGVKDNIYRKPPIYKQHAARRPDGEDGSFEQDNRKQKTDWLFLKGDADTRTHSPDLDSQSLSLSSGTDRDPLQTMQGDNLYSRSPYSKSDPLPGHGKNGLDHRNANLAPCGADPDASWGTREYKVRGAARCHADRFVPGRTCPGLPL